MNSLRFALSFLCLVLVSCTAPGTQERTIYQGETQRACTEKPPSYTNAIEGRLKAALPLAGKTAAEAEGLIKTYLSQQPVGSNGGADLEGYLFYICQIANNGHWGAPETNRAISLFMEKWNTGKQETAKPNSKCTHQLELGYVLKETIDGEYWTTKRDGTFQDRQEEFTARWDREAGEWATKTNNVLLEIGGPTSKGRFQNAMIPSTFLDNTNMKWNGIRNFLQGRLVALESICKTL